VGTVAFRGVDGSIVISELEHTKRSISTFAPRGLPPSYVRTTVFPKTQYGGGYGRKQVLPAALAADGEVIYCSVSGSSSPPAVYRVAADGPLTAVTACTSTAISRMAVKVVGTVEWVAVHDAHSDSVVVSNGHTAHTALTVPCNGSAAVTFAFDSTGTGLFVRLSGSLPFDCVTRYDFGAQTRATADVQVPFREPVVVGCDAARRLCVVDSATMNNVAWVHTETGDCNLATVYDIAYATQREAPIFAMRSDGLLAAWRASEASTLRCVPAP
jgi:hypothetical protein